MTEERHADISQYLRRTGKLIAGVAAVGAVLSGLAGYFNVYKTLNVRPPSGSPSAAPHLSIVVLPFSNTSGDPGQDYVADGITDDITVELSRIKGSFVIGRGTAFSYKGKTLDLKEVARDLNVRYVLQGSAARGDNRFHVTAQLIDGLSGANIWADTVDTDRTRLEEVRQDIVAHLAIALNFQLTSAEAKKADGKSNPDAVDLTMKGWFLFYQHPDQNAELAAQLFTRALKTQADFEPALAGRARMRFRLGADNTGPDREKHFREGTEDALRAIELDRSDPVAYFALAGIKTWQHRLDEAITANARAREVDPNFPDTVGQHAWHLALTGHAEDTLIEEDKAIALSPHDPAFENFLAAKCYAYLLLGRFREGRTDCVDAVEFHSPWIFSTLLELAEYQALGENENVAGSLSRARQHYGNLSMSLAREILWSDNPVTQRQTEENIYFNLRKAGVPE